MLVKVKKMLSNKTYALLAVIFLVGAGAYALDTLGYLDLTRRDTVTVTGSSTNNVKNQKASFTVSVVATNAEKSAAVQEMNDRVDTVIKAITEFGIISEDVKTSNMNVYQEMIWDPTAQVSQPRDWKASTDVMVTLRDVSKASDLSSMLSGLEVSSVYGPNLMVDDASLDDSALLTQALADANQKASALAAASGRRLGEVTKITEGTVVEGGVIMYDRAVGMGGGGGNAIQPGTSAVTRTVTVTYKLR